MIVKAKSDKAKSSIEEPSKRRATPRTSMNATAQHRRGLVLRPEGPRVTSPGREPRVRAVLTMASPDGAARVAHDRAGAGLLDKAKSDKAKGS